MPLIKCYICGGMVSDKAIKCPRCGAPLNGWKPTVQQNSSDYEDSTIVAGQQTPPSPAQKAFAPSYDNQPKDNFYPQPEQRRQGGKGIIIVLAALVFLLAGAILYLLLSHSGAQSEKNLMMADSLQQEELRLKEEKVQLQIEEERRIAGEERQKAENERRRAEEARRKAEEAERYRTATGTYRGRVGSSAVVKLEQDGYSLNGTIRYTRYNGAPLTLTGTIESDGSFELNEYDDDFLQTGNLSGRIKGKYMTGTHYNTDKGTTVSFKLAR